MRDHASIMYHGRGKGLSKGLLLARGRDHTNIRCNAIATRTYMEGHSQPFCKEQRCCYDTDQS
jgi:hypothetical protein